MQRAVVELGERIGVTEAEFATWKMEDILRQAEESYGQELPEFWRTWRDWTKSDRAQPMGDL